MKLWIKYLLGIFVGALAAVILPVNSPSVNSFLASAFEFVIRFGRYILLPFLFFSISSAIFKLRVAKNLVKISIWTMVVILISSLLMTVLGVLVAVVIPLPPIPIPVEKVTETVTIPIRDMIMGLLPHSAFEALLDGAFLLPCFVFAGFLGAGCVTDQLASKPLITVIESASKVFYSIMSFFTDFLSIGMISIMCYWLVNSLPVLVSGTFTPLVLELLGMFLFVSLVVYPLIIRFFCNDKRPYRVIYASICPILVSFFSGDENLSLLLNMRHGKESLGVHHRTNAVSYPMFSIFGRSGVSVVLAISFVVILRSYSKLGLTFSDVLWIFVSSFLISFLLGSLPQGGMFTALTVLSALYGRGFDTGYLLLKAIAPVLCSFACAIDTVCAMYGSYIIAVKTKTIEHTDFRHYI